MVFIFLLVEVGNLGAQTAMSQVRFTQSSQTIDTYDFVEIIAHVSSPHSANPFADVHFTGQFTREDEAPVTVDGFCDSQDGTVFRIRFMPTRSGKYTYRATYRERDQEEQHTEGYFIAKNAGARGLVRVDPIHPWHFQWEGTGEHYFWNGTTTYWLMGWVDEKIYENLDRLSRLQVNRVRVAINGRVENGRAWFEDVYPSDSFTFLLNPWIALRPDSVENPGFDVTRFNVPYWQKWDRMLSHARKRGIIVSVVFYVDGSRPGVDPFGKEDMGGKDEQRFYRYAVARFAAFSNVMWDVTNEYRLFRDDSWAEKMGTFIRQHDPYDHLSSVHGHEDFRFRSSPWADFAMYQKWDEYGGYAYMLKNREEQKQTGRIIPQVNEEYGYEDHYPTWGGNRKAPSRSADNRRRLAWQISMAGGYQTTGERANTGGGWLNGWGDDSMTLFAGYGHMVAFFTALPWWTLEPDNRLIGVDAKSYARAKLTHVVFTRDASGRTQIYVDEVLANTQSTTGNFDNWDEAYRLLLANELTQDRPWLGTFYRVALYDRVLSKQEISQHFQEGLSLMPSDAVLLYTFDQGQGDAIPSISSMGTPLDLKIEDSNAVRWITGGGLEVVTPVLIASPQPAAKLIAKLRETNTLSIETWIQPTNTTQSGPARIVSLSQDTGHRNFTLGQEETAYEVRLRTTITSLNGEPSLWTPREGDTAPTMMASRTRDGDLAVIYLASGGEVRLKSGLLKEGLNAEWYNPRDGSRYAALISPSGSYVTPDADDWVLKLSKE